MTSRSSTHWHRQHASILKEVHERFRASLAVYSPDLSESERDELAADDGAGIEWALHLVAIAEGFPEPHAAAPDDPPPPATGRAVTIRPGPARHVARGRAAALEIYLPTTGAPC